MNANVDRYRGFGWQGCPADVIIIFCMTPGYPCRRPLITRDPDPSNSGDANPAPVVIRSPAEIFIRDPVPSAIRPDPVTVRVGLPRGGRDGGVRLPDIAIIVVIEPITIRR